MAPRSIPVVVGVGDIKNRSQKVEDAVEPMQLMLQAIAKSINDTGLSTSSAKVLQSKIDHVGVVNTWTWNYSDLPSLISEKLGVKPKYKVLSHHGGDSPAKLFDEAARRISFRESKVAIVTGGEALASRTFPEAAVGTMLNLVVSERVRCCWEVTSTWVDSTGRECQVCVRFRYFTVW
jgi:hypothetical protein